MKMKIPAYVKNIRKWRSKWKVKWICFPKKIYFRKHYSLQKLLIERYSNHHAKSAHNSGLGDHTESHYSPMDSWEKVGGVNVPSKTPLGSPQWPHPQKTRYVQRCQAFCSAAHYWLHFIFWSIWGKGVKSPKNGIDSANLPPAHGTKSYPSLLGSPIGKG